MRQLMEIISRTIFWLVGRTHDEKLIYFESFHGKQYSDNPKALYVYLKEYYPEYTLVWGVTKGHEKPFLDEKVSYVSRFSFKWFLTMPRAKMWVINTRTPSWLPKSPKTTYLQTWHGTPLKTIGIDIPDVKIPGYTKESYTKEFREESKRWDYLVSPSDYATGIFKQAFAYKGEVLSSGYPRNDALLHQDALKNKALKEELGIDPDKKVILYAPTWRETEQRVNGQYQFTTTFPFNEISEQFQEDMVLLVRMHYLVAESLGNRLSSKVINVSTGYDMTDILSISDTLITDYSSSMFDYVLTDKPVIFYIPDKREYETELRGFYFPLGEHLPGPMVTNPRDLLTTLARFNRHPDRIKTNNYEAFKNRFTQYDTGKAAQQVIDQVLIKRED